MTLRRRAVVAILVAFPVGWLYFDVGWRLFFGLLAQLRGSGGNQYACGGDGPGGLIGQFNGCNSLEYRTGYAAVELIIGTLLAAAIAYGLARWVSQPLRQMTGAVEQLGPTNLGLRLRQAGPPRDETRRLGDSIDAMLDRVAEGYEAQRRFASSASHELRTPLATQRALIEISLASAVTPEQLDLLSRQLLATNERNERLVDGLLTLAETERGVLGAARVEWDRIVAEGAAAIAGSAERAGVTLTTETAPVAVTGEAALLERLVGNLVQNAVKYNEPGGTVHVRLSPDGVLTVANTGPVIASDAVAGLFEPFRRASGERLDHSGGVGLGLTIARSIVAAHGGRIDATANPGGGLTVVVVIPRAG